MPSFYAEILGPVLARIKQDTNKIGDLDDLNTGVKTDLVTAINWLLSQGNTGGGGAQGPQGPQGSSGGSVYFSDTPPPNPTSGTRWVNTVTGIEYLWFNDGTSSQWVNFG